MTGFKPGDRVRHHTGVEGTVTRANGNFATVDWNAYVRANVHHTDLLTPLGEPMKNEFASAESNSDRTLVIDSSGDCGILKIMRGDYYIGGINLDPANAPALALAILEAAGVEPIPFDEAPETEAGHAAWVLRHHVQASEEAASKAADRAKLESEAWELWLAYQPATGCGKFSSLHEGNQAKFLTLARRARELHGVTA